MDMPGMMPSNDILQQLLLSLGAAGKPMDIQLANRTKTGLAPAIDPSMMMSTGGPSQGGGPGGPSGPGGGGPDPGAAKKDEQPGGNGAMTFGDPYSKGVEKALKESGYDHTQEALNQGMHPLHILGKLGQMFGSSLQSADEFMQAAAGAPTPQRTYETELGKRKAAAEAPMSAYEQASIQGAAYQARVTAMNDQLQRLNQNEQFLIEQQKQLGSQRNVVQGTIGGLTPQQKVIQKQIEKVRTFRGRIQGQMMDFQQANPNLPGRSDNNELSDLLAEAKRRKLKI